MTKAKYMVVVFLLCIVMMLCGCGNKLTQTTGDANVDYYTDPKTGVVYVVYNSGYGGGICPRYNADGSLYVEEGAPNYE